MLLTRTPAPAARRTRPARGKAVNGVYGPQFTHGDGGGAWDLPPGRQFEVVFPLVSNRALKGPAGGPCPQTLNDLSVDRGEQRDCLLIALHVADGTRNPWLLPDEQMVIGAGAGGGASLEGSTQRATLPPARQGAGGHAQGAEGRRQRHGDAQAGQAHARQRDAPASAQGQGALRVRLSKAGRSHLHKGKLAVVAKLSKPKATLRASVRATA